MGMVVLFDAARAAEDLVTDFSADTLLADSVSLTPILERWLCSRDETWHLRPDEVLNEARRLLTTEQPAAPSAEFP